MHLDFLIQVWEKNKTADAVVWKGNTYSYGYLLERIDFWRDELTAKNMGRGTVVVLEADFSPDAIALLLALIDRSCIIVPITTQVGEKKTAFTKISQAEISIVLDHEDCASMILHSDPVTPELYQRLSATGHPGLILFSSGSTGKSKAAVHDFSRLLIKYRTSRHNLRTLAFLLFDHIGGIDTLFYSLSNGSCIITVEDRSPDSICRAIEEFKVQVLPVTPTFLNLLFISEAYRRYNLSSLEYITYGTEVMPTSTLKKCADSFPHVTILQKYGTTEIGTLRSKSKSSNSLWVKIGGEGYKTRVVDGILHIKADLAMLGYLNAPNPFTEDGWFITGDHVVQNGNYIKFLGRESEIINVGGEKVFPAEVENVIQGMEEVDEVVVYGEKNLIVGNIVCARVTGHRGNTPNDLVARIKRYCSQRLENYMVPVKIEIVHSRQHTSRFKKKRPTN